MALLTASGPSARARSVGRPDSWIRSTPGRLTSWAVLLVVLGVLAGLTVVVGIVQRTALVNAVGTRRPGRGRGVPLARRAAPGGYPRRVDRGPALPGPADQPAVQRRPAGGHRRRAGDARLDHGGLAERRQPPRHRPAGRLRPGRP